MYNIHDKMVYLPTWMVDLFMVNAGKYTVRPMDPIGYVSISIPEQIHPISTMDMPCKSMEYKTLWELKVFWLRFLAS